MFAISKTYFQQLFQIFILYNNYPISNNSPKAMIKNVQKFNEHNSNLKFLKE
jgi:hypothetical protein